jgi:hypothetical protein
MQKIVLIYMVVVPIFVVAGVIVVIITRIPLIIRDFKNFGLSLVVDAYIHIGVIDFFLFGGWIILHFPIVTELAGLIVSLAPTLPSMESLVTYIFHLTFVAYTSIVMVVDVFAVIFVIVPVIPLLTGDLRRSGLLLSEDAHILIGVNVFAVAWGCILYNISMK